VLALRNRDFRLLWSGQLLSALGDWFLVLAIPIHVYRITGSAAATGLMYAATNVPAVVVGPFAGLFVDRHDRRVTLAVTDAVRGALLVAMAFGATPVLVAGVVLERVLAQAHDPASAALVPNIVGTADELASANAASSASGAVVRLIGAPLGGVLFVALGLRALLLLDAGSFFISLGAVVSLHWRAGDHRPTAPRPIWDDLREGLRHVRRTPLVRWITVWMAAFLFCNGAVSGLLVPYVVHDLRAGAAGVGFILSALGAGYLAGAALCRRVTRGRPPADAIVGALMVIAFGFVVLFSAPTLPVALAGAFFSGVGGSVALVTATTTLQRETREALRGRVVAAALAAQQAAQVAGTVIGALLLRRALAWAVGVAMVAAAARLDAAGRAFTTSTPSDRVS